MIMELSTLILDPVRKGSKNKCTDLFLSVLFKIVLFC